MPETTVSGILTRVGMGKLGRLGLEPAERYERARPGELLHVDVKKLGRIEGGAGKRVGDGKRQRYRRRGTDAAGVRRNAGLQPCGLAAFAATSGLFGLWRRVVSHARGR